MRVTKQAQAETRQRILEAGRQLFRSQGFAVATTRDIAREAGIASGTLFNYFATKEALVLTLVHDALTAARAEFDRKRRPQESLEEGLFRLVATGLRKLKTHRGYLSPAVETALSPVVGHTADLVGEAVRLEHLECVGRLLTERGVHDLPPLAIQLYWTLFTGVLGFWIQDKSPKQEDSLALLDQSIRMYVTWLASQAPEL